MVVAFTEDQKKVLIMMVEEGLSIGEIQNFVNRCMIVQTEKLVKGASAGR